MTESGGQLALASLLQILGIRRPGPTVIYAHGSRLVLTLPCPIVFLFPLSTVIIRGLSNSRKQNAGVYIHLVVTLITTEYRDGLPWKQPFSVSTRF